MPTVPTAQSSKSGITTSETGERHIPASTRADGSVRKEIRVRPGYRPPEDVEVYKNRTAEAWKNRGSGGVPGAESLNSQPPPSQNSAAANKNAKRREARKKTAAISSENKARGAAESGRDVEQGEGSENTTPLENGQSSKLVDSQTEKEKDAKKLAKKLRQARELNDKKEKGDTLLPEQFEKVIRINELIRQLDGLGFDANGEKKAAT